MATQRLSIDPAAFDPEEVDPELAALNRKIVADQKTRPDPWAMPIDQVRRMRKEGKGTFPAAPKDRAAETITHFGPAGRAIQIRVLRPSDGQTRGTFLHIHGGGWVWGGAEESDPRLRRLADHTGLTVASVEYRLAPEHPFPAAPDDCASVAVALANGHLDLPRGFLAIGGESAGAHLSVLTLIRLRDDYAMMPFKAANLVAGCYDLSLTPSVRRCGEERLVLNADDIKEFVLRFVPDSYSLKDPAVSPLYADLSGLPAALFSCGTADLLIDDTLFMATRWATSGSRAELSLTNGGAHVFQAFPSKAGERTLDDQEAFLRNRMAGLG
ncbi:alpha/beta hydrolase [Aurantimonas sp. VKM B-3413]|uniref:alpha/beta hydrolase n=1 Tax=Aurantimonas sp. VKM B-3413 TaxID=2779401 RepID=UPI001E60BB91|nr:alpha/beta hydrolase fold domain-containing protein [Aurantimonas sp. VKM B-3413]MCB8839521.1 alpha/beta hydrolase [Aurantimonas sp. VKM B-3413]